MDKTSDKYLKYKKKYVKLIVGGADQPPSAGPPIEQERVPSILPPAQPQIIVSDPIDQPLNHIKNILDFVPGNRYVLYDRVSRRLKLQPPLPPFSSVDADRSLNFGNEKFSPFWSGYLFYDYETIRGMGYNLDEKKNAVEI